MTSLGNLLKAEKARTRLGLGDLTVLSNAVDPYRLDTKANHIKGQWFRDQMERAGLFRTAATYHNRGIHYAVVSLGDARLPEGSPYINNFDCWMSNSGAITMVRQGQGTRPTEYALNFEFPASGIAGDTSSTDEPSGIVGDTSSGIVGNTSSAASGIAGDTESYLRIRPTKAEIRIDRIDPAAPLAPPPADGLAATAAGGTAVEGLLPTFEVLWRTYGFARGKKVARRAWSALPIEVDRAAVIRAASEWQASWAAQGKPDAPRKHLATWLKDECYDENAPKGFVRVEKPGKIQPKPRQLAAPTTTHITGTLRAPPPIIAKKIVAAGVEREDGERLLSIEFEEGGSHSITLEANDSSTQAEGQREFGLLLDSVGLSDVDDPAQLVGRTVHVQGGQFVPKPDDDDDDTIIDQAA